jgi:DNA repair protein RadC
MGTTDCLLVDTGLVFRTAIIASAAAIILMHNHPSEEPDPSEADIRMTHDLIQAGRLLNIGVLDHIIVGNPRICSLRQLGYLS